MATVLYVAGVYTVGTLFIADVYYKQSVEDLKRLKYEAALLNAETAISLNPYEANYYRNLAKMLVFNASFYDELTGKVFKEEAVKNLKIAYALNPKNLATVRNSVPIYSWLAVKNLNEFPTKENIDAKYLEVARDYFNFAKESYPHDAGLLVDIAKYEKQLGLTDELKVTKQMILDIRPDLLEWHEDLK